MKKQLFFILCAGLLLGSKNLKAQSWSCATSSTSTSQTPPTGCTYSSSAYTNKYMHQYFYVPTTTNTPVVKVKYAFHIFDSTQTTKMYKNNPTDIARLNQINAWVKNWSRYSDGRVGSNAISPTYINDSRVEYECVGIYFYTNDALYKSINFSDLWNYVNNIDPSRLEALPIFFNQGTVPSNGAGMASNVPSLGDVTSLSTNAMVITRLNQDQGDWFAHEHLLHEIGHTMGWWHTYDDGGCDLAIHNCNDTIDFLNDVFPVNNPYCGGIYPYPCNTCAEVGSVQVPPIPTANNSNNVMSGHGNHWISPLQMGRRRRSLSLNYTRKYVADRTSDSVNVWNVTSNETWDFDMQMYNDIVVKAGNTLTVKCKIGMAIGGKIKVEKGAKLLIDGGEITGWCKTGMWTGVELDGSSSNLQNVSGGYYVSQGYINIIRRYA